MNTAADYSRDSLVQVKGVSKKFCRDLKKSLWYGVRDIAAELNPFQSRNEESGDKQFEAGKSISPIYQALRAGEFWAVKDVSFELRRGECLGLIGRNGAGKTTLLKMLNGLIKPDHGRIEMHGRVGALIALGAGFNPILTGRENIYVNGAVLGLTKREIDEKVDEIIDFAEIKEFIDSPVQSYSSGMQVRLGFAVATALKPDILLLDEVLAVGDAAFRGKCFQRVGAILNEAAVIFVSHNEAQVSRICNSALVLEAGSPTYYGNTAEALRNYRDSQLRQAVTLRLVKDRRVADLSFLQMPDSVLWGDDLKFQVKIQLTESISAGVILVHFARGGEFRANSEVPLESPEVLRLNAGSEVLTISVGPIHLAHGRYHVSLSIFDEFGKNTVLQAFDFSPIDVIGPVGSGPTHLIPMSMQVRSPTPESLLQV